MNLQKRKPWRSAYYKAYIVSLPCAHCYAYGCQAHHEQRKGHGGKSTKCGDERTVPLCHKCHYDRHLAGRGIWQIWGKEPEDVIRRTQEGGVAMGKERGGEDGAVL